MSYTETVNKVSKETGILPEEVDKIYRAYWKAVRTHIETLSLKEDVSEEDYRRMRTSVNIPSLGKLCCTYSRYKALRERFKRIKRLRENANKEAN